MASADSGKQVEEPKKTDSVVPVEDPHGEKVL